MLNPVSRIVAGLKTAIKGLVKGIGNNRNTGSSDPTLVFYFVRCVEALAVYIIMDEQLLSGNLAVITDDIIKTKDMGHDR